MDIGTYGLLIGLSVGGLDGDIMILCSKPVVIITIMMMMTNIKTKHVQYTKHGE